MEYTVFLWEPYICAHLLPWVHGLVKDKRVKAVYYIAPCAVIAYRKEMGWSENDIPKNDGVNYIIAPDDKNIKDIDEKESFDKPYLKELNGKKYIYVKKEKKGIEKSIASGRGNLLSSCTV